MKRNAKKYNQLFPAVFMICMLAWLTVSAPFVYASQVEKAKLDHSVKPSAPADGSEEETAKPIGSEEKSSTGTTSLSEEYLHELHAEEFLVSIRSTFHKTTNDRDYIAFHGELLVPPPNVA